MTDAALEAKDWLTRTDYLQEDANSIKRALRHNESKLNIAVSRYDYIGRGHLDPAEKQKQHEDALIEQSMLLEELERIEHKLTKERLITRRVLEQMQKRLCAAILFDRYINGITWAELTRKDKYHFSRAQLFRKHTEGLEELAQILNSDKVKEIPQQVEKELSEQRSKIRTQATA